MNQLAETEKIVRYLESIKTRPTMHFGCDDIPAIAQAHLTGIRYLALKLFDFDGSTTAIMDEAVTRRGYWYYADGVIPALKKKNLNDKEIVAELIETEIEFWKIYLEQLIS